MCTCAVCTEGGRFRGLLGHPLAPVCALGCCHGCPVPTSPLPRAGCSFHSPSVVLGAGGRPVVGLGRGPSRCASRTEAMAHALCCPAASLECRLKEHMAPESQKKVGTGHAPPPWCCPCLCLSLCKGSCCLQDTAHFWGCHCLQTPPQPCPKLLDPVLGCPDQPRTGHFCVGRAVSRWSEAAIAPERGTAAP